MAPLRGRAALRASLLALLVASGSAAFARCRAGIITGLQAGDALSYSLDMRVGADTVSCARNLRRRLGSSLGNPNICTCRGARLNAGT